MKIQINDKYHIDVDAYNHTLIETYVSKKKESDEEVERTRSLGSFRSVETTLVRLSRYIIAQRGETLNLNEYLTELRNVQNELIDAVRGEVD